MLAETKAMLMCGIAPGYYVGRLIADRLIVAAVIDKNRASRRRP